MQLRLWACGFNAWGQLDFANAGSLSSDGMPEQGVLPQDLEHFVCILSDNEIDVLETSMSSTLGELSFSTSTAIVTCCGNSTSILTKLPSDYPITSPEKQFHLLAF